VTDKHALASRVILNLIRIRMNR